MTIVAAAAAAFHSKSAAAARYGYRNYYSGSASRAVLASSSLVSSPLSSYFGIANTNTGSISSSSYLPGAKQNQQLQQPSHQSGQGHGRQQQTQLRSMTVLSKQSKEEYAKMNYSKRMKASGKPVSPHVLIYAFPVAALSSITNRVTGVMLSLGCGGLATLELVGGSGTSLAVMDLIGSQGFVIGTTAKFAVAFPVSFHYLAAVRHMAWDYKPELLGTNEDVAKASYYLFGASTVVSVGAAVLL